MLDNTDAQAEKFVDRAHPFSVAPGQVIVDGDDMNALALKSVEVGGQSGHQGFTLAGLHLGDFALMEDYSAHQLDVEVTHADGAAGDFPDDGKGFNQDVI